MRKILGFAAALIAALFLAAPVPQASAATTHTPVVFVHGFSGSASNWTTAIASFRSAGYSSDELYAFQYNWAASNKTSAAQLATYVDQVRARTGSDKVDIVNHSMGGLVTRWYVSELGGDARVRHVASLAGANHGTTAAGACLIYASCVEMLPGSAFIGQLTAAGDETPGTAGYATWYSPCDGVINPYTSTRLSGATNNYLACENHLTFLTDPVVLTAVRNFLAS
ncbi:esterase/lipase family protein [Actinomadura macrotermitis]|uniref:Extracellular esterase EstB n=1 Tax=Actinomadura macrotermitis TaxID=2585200 RepID=A0A7K0BNS9_9ACTN|nr:triacylglycerol lipase [Actinomadura macrotermitis]MQY02813.1 Extracellular esterase EstB [Actinomadura macrotermitis]